MPGKLVTIARVEQT